MKHGEQAKLASRISKSSAYVSEVLRGKRRPSPDAAVALEKATGISRSAWLWPEEYPNPLIHTEPEDADREPL